MTIKMSQVILTNTEIANVENDSRFPAYKQFAVSSTIREEKLDGSFSVGETDLGLINGRFFLSIVQEKNGLFVEVNNQHELPQVFLLKEQNFDNAIELKKEDRIELGTGDSIAILIPEFFQTHIYGGAEKMYCISFV